MPNIKLRDGSGVEQVYEGVDTISVPLADGSGTYVYGLTDDELKFSEDSSAINRLSPDLHLGRAKTFHKYVDRWNIDDCSNLSYVFQDMSSDCDVSSIVIRSSTIPNYSIKELEHAFQSFECDKLPKIAEATIFNYSLHSMFYSSSSKNNLTSTEINRFLKDIKHLTSKYYQDNNNKFSTNSPTFQYMLGYRNNISDITEGLAHIQNLINNMSDDDKCKSTSSSNYLYAYMNNINALVKIYLPVYGYSDWPANFTSNFQYPLTSNNPILNSFRFGTEDDGTPKVVHWESQTFDLSSNIGYYNSRLSAGVNYIIESEISFTDLDDNLFYDSSTNNDITTATEENLIKIKANYDRVKGRNKPYLCGSSATTTFDGKSLKVALLYSNYNHASAVETINSLPDTSAYLASSGGTNTIKFKNYSGALTDAGGTNNLTEAEIAVAAAKGWTVTLV